MDTGGEVFVGRADELGRLERALAAAASGSGAAALVAGDAGIGKTRLTAELAARAEAAGFRTLVGRCLDLVGTELPFQPFAEALRPLRDDRDEPAPAASRARVFEDTLALVTDVATAAPVLLVLEDLHWADPSTLDLVVYLAHNLDERRVLLLGTYRADEPASAERVRRLSDGVRRSGSALVVELGPLARDELTALLAGRAGAPSAALADAIAARAEGNAFFAEELLAAAGEDAGELPRGLRDLLLARVARLDPTTQGVLRLAAAAGRDVGYPLLRAAAAVPEPELRAALREAVEHGVLVADQAAASFRFRHALLAEAIYSTLLPGEREEVHARLADELARGEPPAPAAELAPHWATAGRAREALVASVEAAREADAVFGLAEAVAHLERALALWDEVPEAAALAGVDRAGLSSWAAERAIMTGAGPRAVELGRRAIELVGDGDPIRAALLQAQSGRYLLVAGQRDAALAAFERAVELVPPQPPSVARAEVLAALGHVQMLTLRHEQSRATCEEALALARTVGAPRAECRALTVLGTDLAYLGDGEAGLAVLREALHRAEENRVPEDLMRAYVCLTDALTMLGRPGASVRVAVAGAEALRRHGIEHSTLISNHVEALVASGEWDDAERVSAMALRDNTDNWPHQSLVSRAELEAGRGDFARARAHLDAALATVREDERGSLPYDLVACELALWERRWEDAEAMARDALARTRPRDAAVVRVQLCAQGLRGHAELAALARARRDADGVRRWRDEARKLLDRAHRAAAQAGPVTPNAAGWRALAEAEHERARDADEPERWAQAAVMWQELERPPVAAYCHWRQAEALVAAGAPRAEASEPLRRAHAVAARIGARPLLRELDLLAGRARLDLALPDGEALSTKPGMEEELGLTRREAEVLALVARGMTNREIADELVISVKTASVHVSHILSKLDVPTRVEAAAIAHRLAAE
jgi:DNA-binding CsgD family transcriptional regulator/tetratricopeptide (TPR) repeat protein